VKARGKRLAAALLGAASFAFAAGASGQPTTPGATPDPATTPPAIATSNETPPAAGPSVSPQTHADAMRAYHAALSKRRLGQSQLRLEDVRARVAEAEEKTAAGRVDEAIARLTDIVEHPSFDLYASTQEGRAAVFRLGDALATAGIYEPARGYLRRIAADPHAWEGDSTYARRSVRRLVDVAVESQGYAAGEADVQEVLTKTGGGLPEETRGEVAYLRGRAREAAGDPDGALTAYGQVTQRCRFWAQSTYLMGIIQVEKGNLKEGENLFCKVADPKKQSRTAAAFGDEHFFAVRDLARLGLGRVAHEQGRNDDARYYYYLVPRDSDRLPEALYESATTRYEKKDYDGARELLDELKTVAAGKNGAQPIHHRYEDEAWILDAYVDLARCKFDDADKKLLGFVARYEPVRDAARRIAADERSTEQLLTAVRTGSDAGGQEVGGTSPEVLRTIAALVRLDPSYGAVAKRRALLEREASGLRASGGSLDDMRRSLATAGGEGVRPTLADTPDDATKAADTRAALDGLRRQVEDLEAAYAPPSDVAPLRQEIASLEAQLAKGAAAPPPRADDGAPPQEDLAALLGADAKQVAELRVRVDAARQKLAAAEAAMAKDTLHRLDLRLSRLLRRARLGRIESVLGRKRALEVEVEAIQNGYLPQGAFDSLDAARYLKDNEEYWPFEGDDWSDEFVGTEVLK
jgi:hypothetical protein